MKQFKKISSHLLDFILTILAINLIILFFSSLWVWNNADPSISWWKAFSNQAKDIYEAFLFIDQIQIMVDYSFSQGIPKFSLFWVSLKDPFIYSLLILGGTLLATFIAALLFEVFHYFSPRILQNFFREIAFFIQSIPDVIMIFNMDFQKNRLAHSGSRCFRRGSCLPSAYYRSIYLADFYAIPND